MRFATTMCRRAGRFRTSWTHTPGHAVSSLLCPALLLLQGVCLQLWSVEGVWLLYPLIVHLPVALALILNRRARK